MIKYRVLFTAKAGALVLDISWVIIGAAGIAAMADLFIGIAGKILSRRFAAAIGGLDSSAGEIVCLACKEEIKPGALICKHCKTDLSWRRHLQIGQTSLALVTAFVAVLGAVAPNIKSAFQSSHSQISYTMTSSTFDTVTLLVTNYGPEMGLVSDLTVWVIADITDAKGQQSNTIMPLRYKPSGQQPFAVKSQATEQVTYRLVAELQFDQKVLEKFTPQQTIQFELDLIGAECRSRLQVTDHGGEYITKHYCQPRLFWLPLMGVWNRQL
ncbi:hypothetical protein [Pseudoduganella sp. RAF53_2]|uniref:hypothetical protein n=1 Tax=unclassified Pseudoduganella TaxID=2637179 RepID=UPI003F988E32